MSYTDTNDIIDIFSMYIRGGVDELADEEWEALQRVAERIVIEADPHTNDSDTND